MAPCNMVRWISEVLNTWRSSAYFFMLLLFTTAPLVRASRLLLTPFPWGSHVSELVTMGEGMTDAGHEVYILLPPVYPGLEKMKQSRLIVVEYERKDPDFLDVEMDDFFTEDLFLSMTTVAEITDFRENIEGFTGPCTNVLSDQNLFQRLRGLNLDLGVVDTFPSSRCYLVLMYRLGIPYVSVATIYEPWLFRNPVLPSFVPFPLGGIYHEEMTFKERLQNTWSLLDWSFSPRMPNCDDDLVTTYAADKPVVSMNYLASRSLLWFIGTDVAIDYARPTMPNEINIGGLTTKPAIPLPEELESLLQQAQNGVVVISFGSVDMIPNSIRETIMEALRKLESLHFIWRCKSSELPTDVPSHIRLMKWIPQNDLLGHPKVKLFITHGGANSQFEGLYHGVPMIIFPLFGDQKYNAVRAESKGVALTMDINNFTPDQLVRNIRKVTQDHSFQRNISRLSRVYRERPMTAKQRAVFWLEHVLQFGAEHLMSSALDIPWYQYLMLDIAALMLAICTLFIFIVYKLITTLCRCSSLVKSKRD